MTTDTVIHIAFAEDHAMFRQAVISFLNTIGGVAVDIEVANGKQLLDKLEEASVLPDICVLDMSMPVMDGFTTLVHIRQRWPDMKILVLSGFKHEVYIVRMMMAGINGYVHKSCGIEEVKVALVAIHSEGYYYSDQANSTLFHLVKTNVIKLQQFNDEEIEFLKYCCTDLTFHQIAVKMNVTDRNVEGKRDKLCERLGVNNRVSLAMFAVHMGLVHIEPNFSGKDILQNKLIKR
ncbi:LuxR family two component transcriptional regulator [Mucilaginibacter gracilis]|uniref:LuxR family two component transcriptional regulator n=1 Tax=Mucilaginibacter gracilis TaxID=423350 RepID=A0A495IXB8_9SPHI|nr:response regulator transcription factor [Mucilaginibacter gracilis]RKR80694.1 LuxR family two component transcriptional regulator [Mucilaginibacter gracilis]